MRKNLIAAQKVFADAGALFGQRISIGSPADTIAETVTESNCTRVVRGTRGLGKIANLVLGSVASQVLHLINVPLNLVK